MLENAHQIPDIFKVALPFAIGIPLFFPLYWWGSNKKLNFDSYQFFLYTGATYLGFVIMEASFGYFHQQLTGWRIWEYRMLPNHHGYGTYMGPFMWPLYGIHIYWYAQVMQQRKIQAFKKPWVQGLSTAVEGPLFEFIGNGIILIAFGEYLFYYFPGDLWHLTTLLVMPHYAIAGIIFAFLINALTTAKKSWGLPVALYSLGLCFTFVG